MAVEKEVIGVLLLKELTFLLNIILLNIFNRKHILLFLYSPTLHCFIEFLRNETILPQKHFSPTFSFVSKAYRFNIIFYLRNVLLSLWEIFFFFLFSFLFFRKYEGKYFNIHLLCGHKGLIIMALHQIVLTTWWLRIWTEFFKWISLMITQTRNMKKNRSEIQKKKKSENQADARIEKRMITTPMPSWSSG